MNQLHLSTRLPIRDLVFALVALFASGLTLRAQENVVAPAQGDLVSAAYRILEERGLEPLTKVTSFYTLAVLNENSAKAFSMIETSDLLQKQLSESDEIKEMTKVTKGSHKIDLVAFRFYSNSVVSLAYLVTTEKGPLCIRLNIYTPGNKAVLKGVQMTTEWEEMDEILDSLTVLPATLNLELKLEELQAD